MLAVVLTLAAIAGLVVLGGRVYTGAILHTGPTLKLRDVWRGEPVRDSGTPGPVAAPGAGPRWRRPTRH